ncbi:glycine betaine ABC transporter substrate-binding protein [Brevibacterium luteolum]|uniref:Glycine/betaine ABC transporter substrate-binding protein n=1 Tax=Brevibacterium luteolum TaxID=199591 RepID=A0A2N6PG40_9MICO|nr:glycine betaine ABC transporter substrate-binding protein [Brevibacterium luteolum]PMB97657.1 glycine/betaine ABC transporter substrate-binding protein [Brevibacterium luteolum]
MKLSTLTKTGGILAASVLALTACGGGGSESNGGSGNGDGPQAEMADPDRDWENCDPGATAKDVTDTEADDNTDITLGAFDGWDESFAAAHLTKAVLEEDGYSVDIESFQAGPGFTGVANGDIDVVLDGWMPLTHKDYIEEFGDKMEVHGCWYNNAKLTIAVNEDSPAQSIADLKDMGDEYGNTLYGIEPGAGLTSTTENEAIPTYGLDNLDFKISSTPAMLAQLKKATDAGDNVAVTLWRPHWAYDAFPVRDLEDPQGAMGGAEVIYNFARDGFAEDNPKAAQLLQNLVLDDENLASLENVMFSDENYGGENLEEAVAEWLEDNPDFAEDWKAGKLS